MHNSVDFSKFDAILIKTEKGVAAMSLCSFSALSDPLIDLQMISHDTPYRTPFNWHTSWQLTAALEGTYRLHAEEREILLNPGDWVLLSPMVRHDFGSSSRKSVALQVFFRRFPPELLPEFAIRFNYKQKLCRTGRVEGEKLCAFAAELKKLIEEDSFCKRSQATVFGLNFIVALLADLPREPLPSTPNGAETGFGVDGRAFQRADRDCGFR